MIARPSFLARAVATGVGLLAAGAGLAIMVHLIQSLAAASSHLREEALKPAAATGEALATHQLEEKEEEATMAAVSAAKADEVLAVPIVAAAPATATTKPRAQLPNHSVPATASGRGVPTTVAPSDLPEVANIQELCAPSAPPSSQAVRSALSMEVALVLQMGGPGAVAAGIPKRSGEGEMQPRPSAI